MVIVEAMKLLQSKRSREQNIFLYSDSQAALKAFDSSFSNSKTIAECRKSLNGMATHYRFHLIWVPGHRDIEGNCKADELARTGTTTEILIDENTIGFSLATCKMRISQNMSKFAQHIWNNNPTCRISKLSWPC